MSATITQAEAILAILQSRGSISPMQALDEVGCFRLAARIEELRKAGHDIRTATEYRDGKHWARYILVRHDIPETEQRLLWGDR